METATKALVEIYQHEFIVEIETLDGFMSVTYLGNSKKDARKHFSKMNSKKEPLRVIKITQV